MFGHPLLSPQVAVTRSGVYVAWQVSPPGSAAVHSELTRIDEATGLPQPAQDEVLAIAPRRIFYTAPGPTASQYLRQEAIPAACRAR